MDEEYGEHSADDSEENVNEKLLDDGSGYQESDTFVQTRLDYEKIGQKYEILFDQLLIIKVIIIFW